MFYKILTLLLSVTTFSFADYAEFSRKTGLFSSRDKLSVYFFDSKNERLALKDETDISEQKYGSLAKAMSKDSCLAGVNGNFFSADKQGSPIGLTIEEGVQISPFKKGAFTVAGILFDTGKNITLMRSTAFDPKKHPKILTAIQSGPFLVEANKITPHLNNEKSTYRTFVATDGQGKWCIGVSSSLTLHELAQWLATPGTLGDFKVHTALNLDGGSSSSFWEKKTGTYFPSFKSVRNYLGIKPRGEK